MSTFVPTKQNLRKALLFCFNLKKSASEGRPLLCEAYGEHAPSIKTCKYWFRRFKSGNFDTSDKEREGRPVKFEDAELEASLVFSLLLSFKSANTITSGKADRF